MYCVKCGKFIENDCKFCTHCGKKVINDDFFAYSEIAEITIIKNVYTGIIYPFSIYIDNVKVVPWLKEHSVTIKVPFGQHKIKIEFNNCSDEVNITVKKVYPYIYVYIPSYISNSFSTKIKISSIVESKNKINLQF